MVLSPKKKDKGNTGHESSFSKAKEEKKLPTKNLKEKMCPVTQEPLP